MDRRYVELRVDEPVVLPGRSIASADVADHLIDLAVGIADAAGRKTVALPRDDILAALFDQFAGALATQRPRDAFGDFERRLDAAAGGVDRGVNALDQFLLVADERVAAARRGRGSRRWGLRRRRCGRMEDL